MTERTSQLGDTTNERRAVSVSVKYAILGLLLKRPSYPYELSVHFKQRVGHAWKVNRGQIYQTVQRLEQEGLVECVETKPGPHGAKRIYGATDQGRKEFERQRNKNNQSSRPLRDSLLLQISMATADDADHLLWLIECREHERTKHMQEYIESQSKLPTLEDACTWDQVGPVLSTSAALSNVTAEMAWLASARVAITRLRDENEATSARSRGMRSARQ